MLGLTNFDSCRSIHTKKTEQGIIVIFFELRQYEQEAAVIDNSETKLNRLRPKYFLQHRKVSVKKFEGEKKIGKKTNFHRNPLMRKIKKQLRKV